MLGLSTRSERRFACGFWRYGLEDAAAALRMLELARGNDIIHFDTADCYGGPGGFGAAETLMGELRARAPSLFAGAAVATKAGVEFGTPYNSDPAYLAAACEASLKRLRVQRIDLFYIHRPDLLAHPAETAGALDALARAGKIGAVGLSNHTPAQVAALTAFLATPLAAIQIEFSPAHAAPLFDGSLDQAMQRGCAVLAWSPLAGGRLFSGEPATPAIARARAKLTEIARRDGVTEEAAAMAFLFGHPSGVTPILGTKQPDRLRACLLGKDYRLARADWYAVLEASLGARMP